MAVMSPRGGPEAARMAQGLQTATLTKHLLQERPGTLGEGDKWSRVSVPCKQTPILEPVHSPHHMDYPPCPPRCCLRKGAHFGMKKPAVPPEPQAAVQVPGAQQKAVGQGGWSPRGLGLQAPSKGTSTRAPSIGILSPSLGSTPRRSGLVITSSVLEPQVHQC